MSTLDDIALKVERAREDLADLDAAGRAWAKAQTIEVVHDHHAETGWHDFRAKPLPEPPGKWVVLLGEIAYHLRSALNFAVNGLVIANHATPTLGNQFPIYSTREDAIDKGGLDRCLGGVAPGPRMIIEQVQPYQRPNRADLEPLEIVARAANVDKHHALHAAGVVTVRPDQAHFDFGRAATVHEVFIADAGRPVGEARFVGFRVTPPEANFDVKVKTLSTVTVVFRDGPTAIPAWRLPALVDSVEGIVGLLRPHL